MDPVWKIYLLFALLLPSSLFAQSDSLKSKLSFTGDFRFRIEQDWDSYKSDGSKRDDRIRLRYRARFGAEYQYSHLISLGLRLRTGYQQRQQDPHITIGDGFNEFGELPIGLEKVYLSGKNGTFDFWIGKNTFPFQKQNELFWSDNVYPEGVFGSIKVPINSPLIETLKVNAGHFIYISKNSTFDKDSYFQGLQILTTHWNNRLELFPSLYYLRNTPNIPDGNETFFMDYSIFHLGTKLNLPIRNAVNLELDYYNNLENYQNNDSIPTNLKDQKTGLIAGVSVGKLEKKGSWLIKATYTFLQRFAAIDFFAQNDWVRWDYSSNGSPDGRLTNFKGLEILAGYAIDKNFTLKLRCFTIDQLVAYGVSKETGKRIRLDLDIKF